ncbi:hypothetical protein [Lacisediminihabitans sp.]|jgi:hypothetical protein|uniref:hypothetical protein n=1 Tax=Lacisediminihabitans sp. TaxID=2787631 RepID=UPI002F92062C
MSNDKPDNNPSVVDAAVSGYNDVADSATSGGEKLAQTAQNTVSAVNHDVAQNTAVAGRSYATAGRNLSVTFGEVEAMTAAIQGLNRFVVPLIGTVGSVATDPDLVASLILSPITGANAEAAALNAAARLSANLVVTEGLALITASVVTTYQLADSALSSAAATLRADVRITGSALGGLSTVSGSFVLAEGQTAGSILGGVWGVTTATVDLVGSAITLPPLIAGIIFAGIGALTSGILTEAGGSIRDAAGKSLTNNPWDIVGLFSAVAAAPFSWNDAWANTAGDFQGILGATGSSYDDILGLLIHDGHTRGMFRDGDAHLGGSGLSEGIIENRARTAAGQSGNEIYGSKNALNLDPKFHILPNDVASMLAGSAQIDRVGLGGASVIRIVESTHADGQNSYIVQIPSTQSWMPIAGSIPNDVTSDLYAMRYGDQTALAHAVFDAMSKAGIATGPGAPPVMLTGFSLGGITAGAMAADPHGYNIQQVVTAGAPIGGMDIPSTTHVTAFEARQDAVPTLDGTANPSSWTTIHQNAYRLANEATPIASTPLNAHLANRYAVMAKENPAVNNDPAIGKFFQGTLTVTDQYATR